MPRRLEHQPLAGRLTLEPQQVPAIRSISRLDRCLVSPGSVGLKREQQRKRWRDERVVEQALDLLDRKGRTPAEDTSDAAIQAAVLAALLAERVSVFDTSTGMLVPGARFVSDGFNAAWGTAHTPETLGDALSALEASMPMI